MLKFLLIFFIVIYLLSYFGKLLFAHWIKKVTGQQMNQNFQEHKKEGEVTIDTNPQKSKRQQSNDGDYVDYEEIKE